MNSYTVIVPAGGREGRRVREWDGGTAAAALLLMTRTAMIVVHLAEEINHPAIAVL